MSQTTKIKEVVVEVTNTPGQLAKVAQTLADKKINLFAIHGWGAGNKGYVNLVTADNTSAIEALKNAGFNVQERDALKVEMPNTPGSALPLWKKLSDAKINVDAVYATAWNQQTCSCVVSTKDINKALSILG